jgi:hypothetical protein
MIVETTVRGLSEGVDLPQDDPEGEDVGLGRVDPAFDAFRGHPTNGNRPLFAHLKFVAIQP